MKPANKIFFKELLRLLLFVGLGFVITMVISLPVGQSDDLDVLHRSALYGHADEGALHVPALLACSTGIDVEETEEWVTLDLEDVAVAADEELWRPIVDLSLNAAVILAGIAADVLHEYIDVFALET